MAGNTRNKKAQKVQNEQNEPGPDIEKAFNKVETPNFDNSSSADLKDKDLVDTSEAVEEKAISSPTKMLISMFEELSHSHILAEKPFTEYTDTQEMTTVLKSAHAPDIAAGIQDIEANPSETKSGYTESESTSKNFETTLESINHPLTTSESQMADSINTDISNPLLSSNCDSVAEDSSRMTLEDLQSKIKEILDIPLPSGSPDQELTPEDIDRRHDENMRILKKQLRLDLEEYDVTEDRNGKSMIRPFAIEMDKSNTDTIGKPRLIKVKRGSHKTDIVPKSNIEDTKKIFGITKRNRPSVRSKTALQCNINDFTRDPAIIVKLTSKPLKLAEPSEYYQGQQSFLQDQVFEEYNEEKDLIEMARKTNEKPADSQIKVVYTENETVQAPPGVFSRLIRLFSCRSIC